MRTIKFLGLRAFCTILFIALAMGSFHAVARQAAETAQTETTSTASEAVGAAADAGSGSDSDSAEDASAKSQVYKSATFYVVLFLILCMFIAVIGKVLQVYELTRQIQGRKKTIDWNKIQAGLMVVALIALLYGAYWSYSTWGKVVMRPSGSEHGERMDQMLLVTIGITTLVFIITQFLLFGFSFKYKRSDDRKAYYYPHNNSIERIWTIVPALVLTALVVFGFLTWRNITNPAEGDIKKALSVEVTGEQFKWNVRYAGDDNQLGSRNYKLTTPLNGLGIDFTDKKSWDDKLGSEIVLPKGRPVRFTINSKDIIHSFYIPEFRVQMNAVPGMSTYFQFVPKWTTEEMKEKTGNPKFDYVLLCNKICGTGHYNMQYKVRVVEEKEYKEWIAKQPLYYNDDIKAEMQKKSASSTVKAENTLALNIK